MEQQTEQQELEDIISSKVEGFGYLFKQVRDEYNLSTDDVARELRLDKRIIIALENEDYKQLPAPAFVCGYIRNYARFLKIKPEPLVEYYKKSCDDDVLRSGLSGSKEKRIKTHSKPSKSSSSSLMMSIISLLAGAALVAGGWQLWLYVEKQILADADKVEQQESILPDSTISEEPDSLLLPELDGVSGLLGANESLEQENNNSANKQHSDHESVNSNSQQSESVELLEGSLLADGSLPADGSLLADGSLPADGSILTQQLTDNSSKPAVANSLIKNDSTQAENSLAVESSELRSSPQEKKNQLVLSFSGDSWISIKDADNKKLLSDLIRSGKTLRLDGKLPYKVFLGDATVVTLSINGVVFNHSSYINNNKTARFKVK